MALTAVEETPSTSIAKVAGSEALDFSENIQIHGGNGYVRDYLPERLLRLA